MAKYDGIKWQRYYPNIKGDILDMSSEKNGNIWACGRDGLVMKYANNTWNSDTIRLNYLQTFPKAEYLLQSIEEINMESIVLATIYNSDEHKYIYYFINGDMNNWTVLDSMILETPSSNIKWGYLQLYSNSFNNLYFCGLRGVWKHENGAWGKILDVQGTMNNVYGDDENYLIAVGDFNKVMYYNGNYWENISDIFNEVGSTFTFKNVWTNGYEIIITGYGIVNNKTGTIIWHGKQNK